MMRLLLGMLLVLGPELPAAAQIRELPAPPLIRMVPFMPAAPLTASFSPPIAALPAAPVSAASAPLPALAAAAPLRVVSPAAAAGPVASAVAPAVERPSPGPLQVLAAVSSDDSSDGARTFDGAPAVPVLSDAPALPPSPSGSRSVLLPASKGAAEIFKKEALRKAFHVTGLGYLAAYHLIGWPHIVTAMAAWTAAWGVADLLRLKAAWAKPMAEKAFGKFLREKEANRFSGAFYASLGVFVTIALFGANPALVAAAVLALFVGDAVSPLVGLRFGVGRYKVAGVQRSLDGTAAAFLVALAIGLGLGFPPPAALGAAIAFTAVDVYPVKPDDNLWIPIVFSSALFFLSRLH